MTFLGRGVSRGHCAGDVDDGGHTGRRYRLRPGRGSPRKPAARQVEHEMKPLAESLNTIARDAARISSLAAGQVERVDRLVTDLTPASTDRHNRAGCRSEALTRRRRHHVGREGGDRRISRIHGPIRRKPRARRRRRRAIYWLAQGFWRASHLRLIDAARQR